MPVQSFGWVLLAFIGRLSTSMPLSSLAALAARPGLLKEMSAMPRLWPFWLYWRETFLTWPIDLVKYSYARQVISMML